MPFTQGGDHSGVGLGASGLWCGCSLVPGRCCLAAGRAGVRTVGSHAPWAQCSSAPKGTGDAAGQVHRRARGVREPLRPRWASLAGWKGGQVCGLPRYLPTSSRLRGEHGARAASDQARAGCRTAGSSGSWLAGPQSRCRPSDPGWHPSRLQSQGHGARSHSPSLAAASGRQAGSHVCLPVALPAARCCDPPACGQSPCPPDGQRGTLAAV